MKTIDINAKEWRDKTYGNSYFSGTVTIDFGMESERTYSMPFQYGYGEQYRHAALELLREHKEIDKNGMELWRYCRENNIIIRYSIQTGCLKRELK